MAYTDDWENLMNGVFGAGGRPRFGGTAQPEAKPQKSGTSAVPDLNAALLENQKQLDALLKKQNAQLKTQDTAVQSALEDSRQMLRDMEADGLLAKGTADVTAEHLGSFEGLAAEVKKTVLGQDAFVDSVVRAMRRPFVLGTERPAARNVILLCGGAGTGRHFALAETARIMAARGGGVGPAGGPRTRGGRGAFCRATKPRWWTLPSTPIPVRKSCFCRICMRPCTPPGRS